MDKPTYHCDASGFWTWRAGAVLSDECFRSQQEARTNYERLKEVYENSEVVK